MFRRVTYFIKAQIKKFSDYSARYYPQTCPINTTLEHVLLCLVAARSTIYLQKKKVFFLHHQTRCLSLQLMQLPVEHSGSFGNRLGRFGLKCSIFRILWGKKSYSARQTRRPNARLSQRRFSARPNYWSSLKRPETDRIRRFLQRISVQLLLYHNQDEFRIGLCHETNFGCAKSAEAQPEIKYFNNSHNLI